MIIDIKKLIKVDDILNAEGTLLGLYKIEDEFLLGSFLNDHFGMVYYSTTIETLKKYFKSEIRLKQVYLQSEDLIVTRKFRNETVSFLKQDLVEMIECGDNFFSEISDSMRNDKLAKIFYDN